MIKAITITLLGEDPKAHGVFEVPDNEENEVFAEVMSASQNEFYKARQNGLEPELVFKLTDYGDYNGEKILIYDDRRMRVIRTYTEQEALFIVAGNSTADAGLPAADSPASNETPATGESSDNSQGEAGDTGG